MQRNQYPVLSMGDGTRGKRVQIPGDGMGGDESLLERTKAPRVTSQNFFEVPIASRGQASTVDLPDPSQYRFTDLE